MEQESTTTAMVLTHSRKGIAQRRQQVGLLLRAGLNQREIAEELHVAVGTVHTDLAAIRAAVALRMDDKEEEALAAAAHMALDADEAHLRALLVGAPVAMVCRIYERIGGIQDRRARWLGYDRPRVRDRDTETLDAVLARLGLGPEEDDVVPSAA